MLTDQWSKSTKSDQGNCVEARYVDGSVEVRDSKDAAGTVLRYTRDEWSAFLAGTAAGEFNLPA